MFFRVWKSFVRYFALGVIVILVFTACNRSPTIEPVQILTVAVEPGFSPFVLTVADAELEGFDIDLMNEIGKEIGFTVEYQSLPFEDFFSAVEQGDVDAAISAITITEERHQSVDFSDPYFQGGLGMATLISNQDILSLTDLQNKKVATKVNTTGADTASNIENVTILSFDTPVDALDSVVIGEADAFVSDAAMILSFIKDGRFTGLRLQGFDEKEYYGIAVNPGSDNLNKINNALETVIQNGTYAKIFEKWFGFDLAPGKIYERE